MQWSEDTTSERLKALRGGMTQGQLAEAAGVSVGVVRKLERGGTASLPPLLSIADALGTDIAVLLGQQAPRRSMDRDERAALRLVSAAPMTRPSASPPKPSQAPSTSSAPSSVARTPRTGEAGTPSSALSLGAPTRGAGQVRHGQPR
ncbi:helix-turn-helix domain-containing protein [Streptomyces griseoviridis]|uniref:helix-turn-helix domain-containing protein n=1 Tax=Streptomyces griseoviridis TaxID=45398 RepID=UPI00342C726A